MAEYSIPRRADTGAAKSYGGLTQLENYIKKERERREERDRAEGRAPDPTPRAWADAREDLRGALTPENHRIWIEPVRAHAGEDGTLILDSPDQFGAKWLEGKLDVRIRHALERTGHGDRAVAYGVADSDTPPAPDLLRFAPQREGWADYARKRFAALGITPREGRTTERYNSVYGDHLIFTASPSFFAQNPQALEPWAEHTAGFAVHRFSEANILGYEIHYEQNSYHMHLGILAVDPATGRLGGGWYKDGKEAMERLGSEYSDYLRAHGVLLQRGTSKTLARAVALESNAERIHALRADEVPIAEVLQRLEAERDPLDPRRWHIGSNIVEEGADGHSFIEHGPHNSLEGHGAIELVRRLRKEGIVPSDDDGAGPATPVGEYRAAVGYLAATHPERVMPDGVAPPLVPHVPEPTRPPYRYRESTPFGRETPIGGPGQFILVDTQNEVRGIVEVARGWGRVAAVTEWATEDGPQTALPVGDLDHAVLGQGFTVSVLSRDASIQDAVEARYPDQVAAGRIAFADPFAPQGAAIVLPEIPRLGRIPHEPDTHAAPEAPEAPEAPPIAPSAPRPAAAHRGPEQPQVIIEFGTPSPFRRGVLVLVDSPAEAQVAARTTHGFGRVSAAMDGIIDMEEVHKALGKGWNVDVAMRDEAALGAVEGHAAGMRLGGGKHVWPAQPPSSAAKAAEKAKSMAKETPDIGPDMMGL